MSVIMIKLAKSVLTNFSIMTSGSHVLVISPKVWKDVGH